MQLPRSFDVCYLLDGSYTLLKSVKHGEYIYINAKLFEVKNKILENKTFLEVSIVTDFFFFLH